MKLIHCADLHLDSVMETHLSPEKAQQRRSELRRTLQDMFVFADRNDVSAILLCGDLFDEDKLRDIRSLDYFLDLVRQYPAINVYYLCGNHEGADWLGLRRLPDNLFTFTAPQWSYYELPESVVLAGCDCSGNPGFEDELRLDPAKVNIAMLHGMTGSGKSAQINLSRLRGKGIDYLALGHLHSYVSDKLDKRGVYAYSGCLAGRGFDECGDKGFILLEIESGSVRHRFVKGTGRPVCQVEADISACRTLMEVESKVRSAAASVPETALLRVVLTGECPEGFSPDLVGLRDMLSSKFYYADVRDKSLEAIDVESLSRDVSLRGEFVRTVNLTDLDDEQKNRILRVGLRALRGEAPDI